MKIPKSDLKKMIKMMEGVPGWESIYVKSKHASSDRNKKELLKLAKKGGERPSSKTHPLGRFVFSYANKLSNCYDADFAKEIKKLVPHWFVTRSNQKKEQLFELARKGEKKPHCKTPLGRYFFSYTNKLSGSYNEVFTEEIKKLVPHWFVGYVVRQKKEELLKLAKTGGKRPTQKTNSSLCSYANESSKCYDATFAKKIKKIAPHWFEKTSKKKKEELLKLAKKGGEKPCWRDHPLGKDFYNYTSRTSSFTKQIKKLAPHWFKK